LTVDLSAGLSVDEYLDRSFDPECELLGGETRPKPLGTVTHSKMEKRLTRLLEQFYRERRVQFELSVIVGDDTSSFRMYSCSRAIVPSCIATFSMSLHCFASRYFRRRSGPRRCWQNASVTGISACRFIGWSILWSDGPGSTTWGKRSQVRSSRRFPNRASCGFAMSSRSKSRHPTSSFARFSSDRMYTMQ